MTAMNISHRVTENLYQTSMFSCMYHFIDIALFLPSDIFRFFFFLTNSSVTYGCLHNIVLFFVASAKLGCGLWSGRYSKAPPEGEDFEDADYSQPGIKPMMFKTLIGRGHPEFSTKRQQDAQEFYLHFLNILEVVHHLKCTSVNYINQNDVFFFFSEKYSRNC